MTTLLDLADIQGGILRAYGRQGFPKARAFFLTVRGDGRILVQLTIEYRPELTAQQTQQSGSSRVAGFSESLSVVVTDGKPMVASQSADPKSDRKVSVEITAAVQPIR